MTLTSSCTSTSDVSSNRATEVNGFFRVNSLDVNDDTEIDWNTLPDPDWNVHSAHNLQRRWRHMKRKVEGYEDKSHAGTPLAPFRIRYLVRYSRT